MTYGISDDHATDDIYRRLDELMRLPPLGLKREADDHRGVRELCDKYGALLIFDEVVTAFRIGLGGAQGFFAEWGSVV